MATLETIPCVCFKDGNARIDCGICFGTGGRPMLGYGYLWPNGIWNDEPPPTVIVTTPAPPETFGVKDGVEIQYSSFPGRFMLPAKPPPTPPSHKLPPVDPAWQPTQRSYLRERALDFAIRAANVLLSKPINGDDLLDSAEYIERWLAQGDKNELVKDGVGRGDRGEARGSQHPEQNTAGDLPSDSDGGTEASPDQAAGPDSNATV